MSRRNNRQRRSSQRTAPNPDETADVKSFQQEIIRLKESGLAGLETVNPMDLSWAEMDMYYQLRWLKQDGYPPEQVEHFREKLSVIGYRRQRYGSDTAVSQTSFLAFLKNRLTETAPPRVETATEPPPAAITTPLQT